MYLYILFLYSFYDIILLVLLSNLDLNFINIFGTVFATNHYYIIWVFEKYIVYMKIIKSFDYLKLLYNSNILIKNVIFSNNFYNWLTIIVKN